MPPIHFSDDVENERLIKTAKRTYSFENTMYGTLGPETVVWDEEANEAMKKCVKKNSDQSCGTLHTLILTKSRNQ